MTLSIDLMSTFTFLEGEYVLSNDPPQQYILTTYDVRPFVHFSTYVNSDVDCPKNVSMIIGTPWHGVVALENFYFSSQTTTDVSDLKTAVSF